MQLFNVILGLGILSSVMVNAQTMTPNECATQVIAAQFSGSDLTYSNLIFDDPMSVIYSFSLPPAPIEHYIRTFSLVAQDQNHVSTTLLGRVGFSLVEKRTKIENRLESVACVADRTGLDLRNAANQIPVATSDKPTPPGPRHGYPGYPVDHSPVYPIVDGSSIPDQDVIQKYLQKKMIHEDKAQWTGLNHHFVLQNELTHASDPFQCAAGLIQKVAKENSLALDMVPIIQSRLSSAIEQVTPGQIRRDQFNFSISAKGIHDSSFKILNGTVVINYINQYDRLNTRLVGTRCILSRKLFESDVTKEVPALTKKLDQWKTIFSLNTSEQTPRNIITINLLDGWVWYPSAAGRRSRPMSACTNCSRSLMAEFTKIPTSQASSPAPD